MTDIVVTVPRDKWADWLKQHGEGDQRGRRRNFHIYDKEQGRPPASEGDDIYVVAHGRLRCLLMIERIVPLMGGWLVTASMVRPVTLAGYVPGFKGWRRRWWDTQHELPFDAWRTEAVSAATSAPPVDALAHGKSHAEQGGSSA